MRRIILALLIVASFAHFHRGKEDRRKGFMERIRKFKQMTPKEFEKWQNFFKFHKKQREMIPHTYDEIANTVNKMKTTWKAKTYERNFKPLLGAILD
jgi:hypothetical protein